MIENKLDQKDSAVPFCFTKTTFVTPYKPTRKKFVTKILRFRIKIGGCYVMKQLSKKELNKTLAYFFQL